MTKAFDVWDSIKQKKYLDTINQVKNCIAINKDDVDSIINFTLKVIAEASRAAASTFWYFDVNGDGLIRAAAIVGGADISNIRLKLGEGIAGKVIKTGESVAIFDVQKDESWSNKSDNATGFVTKTMMCFPLTVHEYTFGSIQFVNTVDNTFFDEQDYEFVLSLTEEISRVFAENAVFPELKETEDAAIMVLRLDGFEEMSESLTPKELLKVLNIYLSKVHQIILDAGGFINDINYDEVVAYWINRDGNSPVCTLACNTAKEIMKANPDISKIIRSLYGFDVSYSIGISFGPIYRHYVGSDMLSSRAVVGFAPVEASELQYQGPAKAISINKKVADQVDNSIHINKIESKKGLFGKKEIEDEAAQYLVTF